MSSRILQIETPLLRLDQMLRGLSALATIKPALLRWHSDAAALRFHLQPARPGQPLLLAVIGGTGTGKSTIVNRLLGVDASATSFRRTFTAGPVVIARKADDVPEGWLGVPRQTFAAEHLPARGENGMLAVVPRSAFGAKPLANETLLDRCALIDTPDLDGDQPAHHAEADRVFRWAQAVAFVVTPEKYQMTELMPYYGLAGRYAIPTLFVMNKCEEQAVPDDYRGQIRNGFGQEAYAMPAGNGAVPHVFVVPRDDAAYVPPAQENLAALRDAIAQLGSARSVDAQSGGLLARAKDLYGRFTDQILTPLKDERRDADRLIAVLRGMVATAPGIDVNPVTQDLERRLQQRSVLYLMGPQRVLDRVRQAPQFLVRLPRAAWDYVMRGEFTSTLFPTDMGGQHEVPDFRAILTDQFSVVQSRIDDVLATSPHAQKWIATGGKSYEEARLAPAMAGNIADEELAELRGWLEKRWNATPRDTKALQALLKFLPGGNKLTSLTESAPYLLVIALITTHVMFGTDLLVIGGYTLATWLTERLSNEVAGRTRAANTRIADRFTRLAHEQIQRTAAWIDQQAASMQTIEKLERGGDEFSRAVETAAGE